MVLMDTTTDTVIMLSEQICADLNLDHRKAATEQIDIIRRQEPDKMGVTHKAKRVIAVPIMTQSSLERIHQQLLRPNITLETGLFDEILSFLKQPLQTTHEASGAFGGLANDDFSYDSYSENAKDADAAYDDLYTNKRSKLLITGCAGVGKSCILRELHVRALWASKNVRVVVIDDYYAWSKMTDSNALGHLLMQIMVGFAEVENIASEFELESWEVEDSEARCAQLLQKIHDYCVRRGVEGIPLKIIFIVDNYCKVDGGSVAHKFINGPVQTHNKTMMVVAATSDSKVVENDNSEYKIPTGYSMTEAVAVIMNLLIPGKDKLVKLWNRRMSSILSVVQRSTSYNPFEMGALFEYVGDTGTMAKFVKKAADFVHDFNDAKKLPKLGAKFKRTMAENNNSGGGGGEPITDIEDLSRKLIFQAYFQLQSMSPASRTNGSEQKAFFECHPFISSGSKDTSVGSKRREPYRFSSPRAGNYVFRHAFGKDFPGREISKLYGMDDASRYDLAYAALKWLYGTVGFTIDNEENKSTLYELHGTEQKQIGVELVNLKSTELEPNTNAQLVYSHPCYTYAMNSTGGLDFGFRLANGFSVMEYIVVMMFGDDENVEDAVEELKTWNSYKNYSGAISPMSPHKRVLSGISSANYYKNAQREKGTFKVTLLGTASTIASQSKRPIADRNKQMEFRILNITESDYLSDLGVEQFF